MGKMNSDKVYQIAKRVYETHPVSKKERTGCQTEKAKNDTKRFELAKRLVEIENEKLEVKE